LVVNIAEKSDMIPPPGILQVARTRAGLDGDEAARRLHLAEARAYRALTDDLRRVA
jgi:hypothetical protein